jgi:hypothetical protein
MWTEDLVETERILNRFRKLLEQMMRGTIVRNSFEPWEVEILLDMESCAIDRTRRGEILEHYLRSVERQLESGSGPPMKMSEFLQRKNTRRPSTE